MQANGGWTQGGSNNKANGRDSTNWFNIVVRDKLKGLENKFDDDGLAQCGAPAGAVMRTCGRG